MADWGGEGEREAHLKQRERERRETGRESGEGNNLDFCRCMDADVTVIGE